jgi:hypothetical protein
MFTRFTLAEIDAAAPTREVMQLLRDGNERDQALYLAVVSLERIAGADSPEGDAPEVDALRNLARVRRLLESEARGS